MNVRIVLIPLTLGMAAMDTCALADSFMQKCPDLVTCTKSVSELTGDHYLYDADLKGTVQASPNTELTRENAVLLYTTALNASGLTRVPLPEPHTYQIMRQRDARDSAIALVVADAHTAPDLPDNWDIYTLKFKLAHREVAEAIARNTRSFMPAAARIIPVQLVGEMLVTDTALNLKKLYLIIKDMDRALTPEMKKEWKEREKQYQKIEELRAANKIPTPHSTPTN